MFTSQSIVLNIFQSPKCPRRFTDKSNNRKIIYFLLAQSNCGGLEGSGLDGSIQENDYFNKKIITQICLAVVLLDSNCFKYSMTQGCPDWVAQEIFSLFIFSISGWLKVWFVRLCSLLSRLSSRRPDRVLSEASRGALGVTELKWVSADWGDTCSSAPSGTEVTYHTRYKMTDYSRRSVKRWWGL